MQPSEDAERAGAPAPSRRERWLLALVVVAALAVRLPALGDPWSGHGFRSAHGSFATGVRARVFAEHGFLESAFLPLNWRVELADGALVVDPYTHHPALFAVLCGLSLRAFGMREWALELPALLFSLAGVWSCWRAIHAACGPRAALRSAVLLAVIPMSAWYGPQAWSTSAELWLHGLLLWRWWLWTRGGRARDLALAATCVFAGGLLDWSAHFVLPGLGLHALFVARRERSWRRLLAACALPLAAAAAVAVHWVHLRIALPADVALSEGRTTLRAMMELPVPLGAFLGAQWEHVERLYTWPVLVLAAAGAALLAARAVRGRSAAGDVLAPLAFLPGLVYVAVFPFRSANHDFYWYPALPGIAVFAALGLGAIEARLPSRAGRAAALGLLAVAALVSVSRTAALRAEHGSDQVVRLARSEWLAPILRDSRAVVLATTGLGQSAAFYSAAPVVQAVDSPEQLQELRASMLARLGPGRRVVLLIDLSFTLPASRFAARPLAGVPPEVHVIESSSMPPRAYALLDLTDWNGELAAQ